MTTEMPTPINIDLGSGPSLLPVFADRIMIEQVLVNFLRNAREAMHLLPVSERIAEVRTRRLDAQHAIVEVADRGSGVPPEVASQLFSPFFSTIVFPARNERNDGWPFAAPA